MLFKSSGAEVVVVIEPDMEVVNVPVKNGPMLALIVGEDSAL